MSTVADIQPWYTHADIARMMQVDKRTVIRWIDEGVSGRKLRAVKIGNTTRIAPEWWADFLSGEEDGGTD